MSELALRGSDAPVPQLSDMPDDLLEARLRRLAGIERKALGLLLAHLMEFDSRKLYTDRGHPSLFAYCVRVLGYSEQGAYKRIQAARAARSHPLLLQRLTDGQINLAAIVVLAPHLRAETIVTTLDAARGKSTREIEAMAACWAPKADAPELIRALPAPSQASSPKSEFLKPPPQVITQESPAAEPSAPTQAPAPPKAPEAKGPKEKIEPLSAERFLFRFTAGADFHADYLRAKDLLPIRRAIKPAEGVFQSALAALLERLDPLRRDRRRRQARKSVRQKGGSIDEDTARYVPAGLRDAVWIRDAGQCAFVAPDGSRCSGTRFLEIDHIRPYALGGRSDDAANLRLLCRAHNQLLARRIFGVAASKRKRSP
jgi:hypothetical protein